MFSVFLQALEQYKPLRRRVLHVLNTLPKEIQQDFLSDPRFTISLDNYVPGEGSTVFMAAPGGGGFSSRSVVLKLRLSECDEAFAHYVIAHEFAMLTCGMGSGVTFPTRKTRQTHWQHHGDFRCQTNFRGSGYE